MPELIKNPTLKDLQQYVKELCQERGWDKDSYLEKHLMFSEEVGELTKAIRRSKGLYKEDAKNADAFALREEFADVLSYILDLANYFQIDLEEAFIEKETINKNREWKK